MRLNASKIALIGFLFIALIILSNAANAATPTKLYVLNQGQNKVYAYNLNAQDWTVTSAWTSGSIGTVIQDIVACDKTNRLYVADRYQYANCVKVLNAGTGAVVTTISLSPKYPISLALSQDENILYVFTASNNNQPCAEIWTANNTIKYGSLAVGGCGVIANDGTLIADDNAGGGTLKIINPESPYGVYNSYAAGSGGGWGYLTISPDNTHIAWRNWGNPSFSVRTYNYNAATHAATLIGSGYAAEGQVNGDLKSDNTYVYESNGYRVYRFPWSNGASTSSVAVAGAKMAWARSTKLLVNLGTSVKVIDTGTFTVTNTITGLGGDLAGWGMALGGYVPDDYYNLQASTLTANKGATDTTFKINVTRPQPDGAHTSTVDYTLINGTAFNGLDYVCASGTLSFGATDTYKLIDVTIKGSSMHVPNRTFTLALSNPTNGLILGAINQTTVTIVDTVNQANGYNMILDRESATIYQLVNATIVPTYADIGYDEIVWWYDNAVTANGDYKRTNGVWYCWNGTGWTDISTGFVLGWSNNQLAQQYYSANAGTHTIHAKIKNEGVTVADLSKTVTVTASGDNCAVNLELRDSLTGAYLEGIIKISDSQTPNTYFYYPVDSIITLSLVNGHVYYVEGSSTGYVNKTVQFGVAVNGASVPINLESGYDAGNGKVYMSMTVVNVDKEAIAGATVALSDGQVLTTSSSGYVRFTVEASTVYQYTATATGYYTKTAAINSGTGGANTITLTAVVITPTVAPTYDPSAIATYTPNTPEQTDFNIKESFDMLINAAPALVMLCILVVIMGLIDRLKPRRRK